MPELPEVETVRRSLEGLVAGRAVRSVEVRLPRIVRCPDVASFRERMQNVIIEGVARRGKYLLFDLGRDVLVSHLRMEGRYGLYAATDPMALHTHVIFQLDGEKELRYQDVRQFGTMDLLAKDEALSLPGLAELGVEPLDPGFTASYLYTRLHMRRAPVKAVLLDQSVIAGLGNIYVDEILHAARVHPERRSNLLSKRESEAICCAAVDVIARAIEQGGSSVKSYVNGYGTPGSFQHSLRVYGRQGEACLSCGCAIVKGRVAGRGTHVCPSCQKPPRGALVRVSSTKSQIRSCSPGSRR